MLFLLIFNRFEYLKIIKIRLSSQPCHIVTVHSEMGSGKAIALLVGEDVGGDFRELLIVFSIQRIEEFCIKSLLGGGDTQIYRTIFRDGNCRNDICYVKVIALYKAQLCRSCQVKRLGTELLLSGFSQEVEIAGVIHISKACHLFSAGWGEIYACLYLDMAVLLPSCHQTYVVAGI